MSLRYLFRFVLGVALTVSAAGFARAQCLYPPCDPNDPTVSLGSPPSEGGGYGKGKAIGIGVGVAAAVVVTVILVRRGGSKSNITGCVQRESGSDSRVLRDKSGKHQWLLAGDATVPVGERVRLHGKRSKNGNGELTFQYDRMVKSYGSCEVSAELWRRSDQTEMMAERLQKLGFAQSE